ncbi:MAG: Zn-dependent hydrolase [Xanthomonadaceae bacterium]|nr:Zn-dependent hydrolase [Xanthomonadaceae bacterium]
MHTRTLITVALCTVALTACERPEPAAEGAAQRVDIYAPVRLEADLTALTDAERRMVALLIEAAEIMDDLFWFNAYGDRDALLETLDEAEMREFARINYGPWDRLDGNRSFVPGVGEKPLGANFYPADMSVEEFEAWDEPGKDGLYSYVRRNDAGDLILVPYSQMHGTELNRAARKLREAAALAEDAELRRYLEARADALLSDDYRASDIAWMQMRDNRIDVVIGPIENYEDRLFGYRAAFEAFVLIKDIEWSERLARFAAFLPELQRGLPVPDAYKAETPGTDADLNAYDAVYYAGDANAGSKTIAINLPNDETVQLEQGTRRLQLRNAMRAKYDEILIPIADQLVASDVRGNVTFNAFFSNVMFHEVAHGLGIKNTLDGERTVREALREHAGALEEAKADVLGLYMITQLFERGELHEGVLLDHYVTFMAGLFRSVRFGASSAHGRANMIQFNFFAERGAFARDPDGRYRVDFERMQDAVGALANRLLVLQGDGDHAGAGRLLAERGVIGTDLQRDLVRLEEAGIPVDIVFEQGPGVLGLH